MVFDLISFLIGIAAGGLTGALAGILYSFERTADLQERLVKMRKEMQKFSSSTTARNGPQDAEEKVLREVRKDLDSIQEEIRRMYDKSANQ